MAARPQVLDDLAAMPRTVVHFDFRTDHLFFEADGALAVIDWPAISQGDGAADVGNFLSRNLGAEDRRTHEPELLHAYLDTLVANGAPAMTTTCWSTTTGSASAATG
jgi:aminoglycoside phosphotransferase (APT) family kinase protein